MTGELKHLIVETVLNRVREKAEVEILKEVSYLCIERNIGISDGEKQKNTIIADKLIKKVREELFNKNYVEGNKVNLSTKEKIFVKRG